MKTAATAQPYEWDWDGRDTPNPGDDVRCWKTFSVGIFQWIPKKNGRGLKRGKVVKRIKGATSNPEAAYAKATEECERRTYEEHRKNLRALLCGNPNATRVIVAVMRAFLFNNGQKSIHDETGEIREVFEFMVNLVFSAHRAADWEARMGDDMMMVPDVIFRFREYIKLVTEGRRQKFVSTLLASEVKPEPPPSTTT